MKRKGLRLVASVVLANRMPPAVLMNGPVAAIADDLRASVETLLSGK